MLDWNECPGGWDVIPDSRSLFIQPNDRFSSCKSYEEIINVICDYDCHLARRKLALDESARPMVRNLLVTRCYERSGGLYHSMDGATTIQTCRVDLPESTLDEQPLRG